MELFHDSRLLVISAKGFHASRYVVICCSVEVFDEDYFVADFVVEQLVDSAACEKKTVSPGAHSLFLA